MTPGCLSPIQACPTTTWTTLISLTISVRRAFRYRHMAQLTLAGSPKPMLIGLFMAVRILITEQSLRPTRLSGLPITCKPILALTTAGARRRNLTGRAAMICRLGGKDHCASSATPVSCCLGRGAKLFGNGMKAKSQTVGCFAGLPCRDELPGCSYPICVLLGGQIPAKQPALQHPCGVLQDHR